jgi:ribosomal protein L11 methyltransferase
VKWTEISVRTSSEAIEAVSELLMRLGAAGVAVEDPEDWTRAKENPYGEWYDLTEEVKFEEVRVKGYFPELIDTSAVREDMAKELANFTEYGLDPGAGDIVSRVVDEEDWANAWKQFFKPVRVTEGLTIKPTWESYEAGPSEQIIELDPGMAFGTGTHPTTVLCIRLLEQWLPANASVADVGTGSAILSIACAKLGAERVLALDLDPVAVQVAAENVKLNRVEDVVAVQTNDLLKEVEGPFHVVVANILADIIACMIPDAYRVLKADGVLIASGIIREKADWVRSELERHGFLIREVGTEQDWTVIVASKPAN